MPRFRAPSPSKILQGLREALAVMPKSHILVETDTPFLTPDPHRGKPNSPYMVPYTVVSMAHTLKMDVSLLAAQLTSNTHDVYGRWDDHPLDDVGALSWLATKAGC